jgi:integrator complex subunit 4
MLEDDSMDVRLSGISTMSAFAKQCKEIRKRCLNFLIDMLNDEIDEVRIGALHGISHFNDVLALNVSFSYLISSYSFYLVLIGL